jgi:nucleoside-diphosphate-sugar epimerase
MRITVTGAAGGIGRYVVAHLVDSGVEVVAFDRARWVPSEAGITRPSLIVTAQADDRSAVAEALRGSDAVIHLAGIPSPTTHDPVLLFRSNTAATMTVLTEAAEQGIRAAVIASSISALGLVYSPHMVSPMYAPIDECHPLRPDDAYALSKQCDEAAGEMTSRRYEISVLAFRFPFTATASAIRARAADMSLHPEGGARELWAYLDVRDAARACRLGVEALLGSKALGYHAVNVVADDSLSTTPLTTLLARYHPRTVQLPALAKSRAAYTTNLAESLLGFRANHVIAQPRSAD